jgi:sugar/nucleoside kinase (ribokinase family)
VSLVVAGDVMCDVVAVLPGPLAHGSDTPAAITLHGGGSAANVAAWAAAAGAEVTLVGRVGDDALGREAVASLRAAGVRTQVATDPRLATGACIVLVHPGGERTMVPDAGANDALEVAALPAGRHLHLPGYALLRPGSRPAALAALALARERGMTVSVDPSSSAPLEAASAQAFLEWVAGVDLLLPNADEARVLTGEADPEAAALALAGPGEVVVTLGAEGALWTDGREVVRVAAESADVVDTTGAGDAFAAGLLAARLGGADPAAALAAGCRLAARAVASTGARPPLSGYD